MLCEIGLLDWVKSNAQTSCTVSGLVLSTISSPYTGNFLVINYESKFSHVSEKNYFISLYLNFRIKKEISLNKTSVLLRVVATCMMFKAYI